MTAQEKSRLQNLLFWCLPFSYPKSSYRYAYCSSESPCEETAGIYSVTVSTRRENIPLVERSPGKHRNASHSNSRLALSSVVMLFVDCLTSQQHASVSQGRICSDNFTCCHTETEVADQTFHLTQSQYTDTGPTSHSTDPITPGAWQGSHWRANF